VLLVAAFSIYFVTIFGTFYDQPHCWVPTVKLSLYFYNPINYLKSIHLAIVWPESFALVPLLADNYKLTLLLILAEIIVNATLVPVLVCCTKASHWQCLLRIRLLRFPCCCKRDIITPVSNSDLEKGWREEKEKAEKQRLAKELKKRLEKAEKHKATELKKQQIQQQKEARAQQKHPFRALPLATLQTRQDTKTHERTRRHIVI
jgi:hypothetical protein